MNRSRTVKWVSDVLRWSVHPAAPYGSVWKGQKVLCAAPHSCWVGATFPSGMWWQAHLGTPVVKKTSRPPPQHSRGQGQSREMRSSKLSRETLETPDVPDVCRRRTCCADYQVGNNSGCFEALVAVWELPILATSQKISAGETCVWKRVQLSCAEVMSVFQSGPDVKLDYRLLLRGRFHWDHFSTYIDSSLRDIEARAPSLLCLCTSLTFAVVRLHQFPTTILSAPPFNPPCAKIRPLLRV